MRFNLYIGFAWLVSNDIPNVHAHGDFDDLFPIQTLNKLL